MSILRSAVLITALALALAGCAPEVGSQAWCQSMKDKAPEVGSQAWCQSMKDKPKGDWTANDATDFAKHCLFGNGE